MEAVPRSVLHLWSERDFNLTPEEVRKIRCTQMTRYPSKPTHETFSLTLSPEGKLAMLQAKEETVVEASPNKAQQIAMIGDAKCSNMTVKGNGLLRQKSWQSQSVDSPIQTHSFTDAYEKLNSLRFKDDITDDMSSTQSDPSKRSIGGGKLGNAMEIVETVVSGVDSWTTTTDEIAIQETANLNSVEKCLAWFEVQHKDLPGYEYALSE